MPTPTGTTDAGESYVIFGFRTGSPSAPVASGLRPRRSVGIDAGPASIRMTTSISSPTGGTDTFFFDDRVGKRDILRITDFDAVSDKFDLGGATIAKAFEGEDRTILQLEGADCEGRASGPVETPFDLLI